MNEITNGEIRMMEIMRGVHLFDHQRKAVASTVMALRGWHYEKTAHYQRMIGVSPTGSGKTVMFFSIADIYRRMLHYNSNKTNPARILILVHTKSLMYQLQDRAVGKWGYRNVGIIGDDQFTATDTSDCVIAIVASIAGGDNPVLTNKRVASCGNFSLVIVDECHRAVTDMHTLAINKFVNGTTVLLGVTATHKRSDETPMSYQFSHTAFVVQPLQLLASNFIAKPHQHLPLVYHKRSRRNIERKNPVPRGEEVMWSQYYQKWLGLGGDNMKTIIFVDTKKEARHVTTFMRKRGHNTGLVLGETAMEDRLLISRKCRVIVNVRTMVEGTDIDGLECAIITTVSVKNTLAYIQKSGRVMRALWVDGQPIAKDCHIIAPRHHDLLATIPTNVVDVKLLWNTREEREYIQWAEDQPAIKHIPVTTDDLLIKEQTITRKQYDGMGTAEEARERVTRKRKKKSAKKDEPTITYYDSQYDRTQMKKSRRRKRKRFFGLF